eukprot:894806-Rhodomonas_salina.2
MSEGSGMPARSSSVSPPEIAVAFSGASWVLTFRVSKGCVCKRAGSDLSTLRNEVQKSAVARVIFKFAVHPGAEICILVFDFAVRRTGRVTCAATVRFEDQGPLSPPGGQPGNGPSRGSTPGGQP